MSVERGSVSEPPRARSPANRLTRLARAYATLAILCSGEVIVTRFYVLPSPAKEPRRRGEAVPAAAAAPGAATLASASPSLHSSAPPCRHYLASKPPRRRSPSKSTSAMTMLPTTTRTLASARSSCRPPHPPQAEGNHNHRSVIAESPGSRARSVQRMIIICTITASAQHQHILRFPPCITLITVRVKASCCEAVSPSTTFLVDDRDS